MEDKEVGLLWAENYPRWESDPAAASICRLIEKLVLARARAALPYTSWSEKIHFVLKQFGIPDEQWSFKDELQ